MKKGGISGSALSGRRALEEQFFLERERELLRTFREQMAAKERKQALAEASGITDEDLLDQLDKLDLGPETLAALSLVPLIAVAWADGKMDAKERQAVLAAAEQKGIQADHPGHPLLEGWLQRPPGRQLLQIWKDYVAALGETLSESARSALKHDLLGRARAVAEAAGGMLGLGSKVSKSEQAVLDELEAALG